MEGVGHRCHACGGALLVLLLFKQRIVHMEHCNIYICIYYTKRCPMSQCLILSADKCKYSSNSPQQRYTQASTDRFRLTCLVKWTFLTFSEFVFLFRLVDRFHTTLFQNIMSRRSCFFRVSTTQAQDTPLRSLVSVVSARVWVCVCRTDTHTVTKLAPLST